MQLSLSARSIRDKSVAYTPLNEHSLLHKTEILGGNGAESSPIQMKIVITNTAQNDWTGIVHIELPFAKNSPRYFMPAFIYGINRGDTPQNVPHNYPRIRDEISYPSSPWWFTRSDRLSHPMALVYDCGRITGFDASPYLITQNGAKEQWAPEKQGSFYQFTGFTCSHSKATLGYTLGYENAPWLFVQSKKSFDREPLEANCITLCAKETIAVQISVYDYPANDETAINKAVENVYFKYHQSPRMGVGVNLATQLLASAIHEFSWVEDDKNYSTFVFERDSGYEMRKLTSTSWTNGLSVAVPMFLAGIRLKNDNIKQQAQKCIDNIVSNSLNPRSQLPYDACSNGVWSIKGWWFDGLGIAGHTAYIVGQAIFYILKAFEYDMRCYNIVHNEWLEFAQKVMQRVEKEKNTDNEYPFVFSQDSGAGLEYDALGSSWCLAAQAYLCKLTANKSALTGMCLSEEHYYNTYIKRMECYGAPLDTSRATDSEGVLAYIRATRYLHEVTGEEKYLAHMRDALCYEFTFKFCYNAPIQVPPLSRINWSSCGGSVTSVANPHIHPMSSSIVGEMVYYCSQKEDTYIKQRLIDVVNWGCQTFNSYDKEFDHGKIGWMSERFCHCQGLLTERYKDGTAASTWFSLMAWAGASIIDGFVGDYWDTFKIDNEPQI